MARVCDLCTEKREAEHSVKAVVYKPGNNWMDGTSRLAMDLCKDCYRQFDQKLKDFMRPAPTPAELT